MFQTTYRDGKTETHATLPETMVAFTLKHEHCVIEPVADRHLCWETRDQQSDGATAAFAEIREVQTNGPKEIPNERFS